VIVPDASVLVPALVDDSGDGALAREVLVADGDLHVPHLADVEVVSVLRRLVLAGALERDRAQAAIADLDELPMVRYPHLGLLPRVWRLRDNVAAYDATYVALAEVLGATFLTTDRQVAEAPHLGCAVRLLE
jgi:predicted nucleic acid-binding protein